jgi:hypothetical protein
MFTKRSSWYVHAFKALFFAGVLYKFSRLFMKSTAKTTLRKVKKGEGGDVVEDIRRLFRNGGKSR